MTDVGVSHNHWLSVFNTPLECGMRSATLLLAAFPRTCDVQRLVQYDYLIVHSGDVEDGPPSIHPATPNRSGELLVRRSLVDAGLEFMTRRGVVERTFDARGIAYTLGEYGVLFVDTLTTDYTRQLRARASWVIDRFQDMEDSQLGDFMKSRWSQWGAEFLQSAVLDEPDE